MATASDWTQDFFTGYIVEAMRRMPQQTDADLAYLLQALEPKPGDRILDVPCGTGRLTVPLAEQGFAVTGVDISAEALGDGRTAAKEKGLDIRFEQRDMRDLPWSGEFDSAFCFGNSFSYFDEAGNRRFLSTVLQALKPGGRFALETHFVAEGILPQLQQLQSPKRWWPFDDLFFLHDTEYDPLTAKLTSNYTLIRKNEIERRTAVYHVYTLRELLRLFNEVGFSDVQVFGSLTREPFRLGSPGCYLVARKPA